MEGFFSWLPESKHNLSKIASVLRTQACTLLKSIYDKGSKSQVFVVFNIRTFQGAKQLSYHALEVVS